MELLFYHLESAPLERVLPDLLSKSLAKGWRATVEAASEKQLAEIDTMLWTYESDSFLPHGKVEEPNATNQPILLTLEPDNLNQSEIRFLVDAGEVTDHTGYQRLVYIFNGHDEAAVSRARHQWKAAKDADIAATYWQQSERGAWEKRA